MAREPKSEFENTSAGFCGVVVIEDGKQKGISVEPGRSIWLTEEEQIATANAPRSDADNPFVNGTLTLRTPSTEIANRRPIGDTKATQVPQSEEQVAEAERRKAEKQAAVKAQREQEAHRKAVAQKQAAQGATPVDETGAAVSPSGQPVQGKRAPAEEVGSPEAPAQRG